MKYEKPEVAVLGDAGIVIQSTGGKSGDSGHGSPTDCELDD